MKIKITLLLGLVLICLLTKNHLSDKPTQLINKSGAHQDLVSNPNKMSLAELPDVLRTTVKESLHKDKMKNYQWEALDNSFVAHNTSQKYRAQFSDHAIMVQGDQNDWSLQMRLVSWGWEDSSFDLNPSISSQEIFSTDNKNPTLNIHHDGLTEWYVNRPTGLEQGFTVPYAPKGNSQSTTLTFDLEIDSSLNIELEASGQALALNDNQGNRLRYSKLVAFDANNKNLPARLEFDQNQLTLLVDTQGAQYPLTIDPTLVTNEVKLLASNGQANDGFGISSALSGNVAVVGAFQLDNVDTLGMPTGGKGKAFVFRFNGSTWVEEAILEASDGKPNDFFGGSVAISGNAIIVGRSPFLGDSLAAPPVVQLDMSAAYIFRFDGTTWAEEAKLVSNDFMPGDLFAYSVDIEDDVAIVLSPYHPAFPVFGQVVPGGGAAYIFRFDGNNWNQEAKLFHDIATSPSDVATAVAISNERAVLSSPVGQSATLVGGNTKVFVHQGGGNWAFEAELLTTEGFSFASSTVDIQNDKIIAGIPNSVYGPPPFPANAGAVSIFRRMRDNTWVEEAKLMPSDDSLNEGFGVQTAISDNRALVGVRDTNKVFLFEDQGGGNWVEQTIITGSDSGPGDDFGSKSFDLTADHMIVGASCDDDKGPKSGSAYAYDLAPQANDESPPVLVPTPQINLCPQDGLTFTLIVEDADSDIDLTTSQVTFKTESNVTVNASPTPLPNGQVQYSATFPLGTNPGAVQASGVVNDTATPTNTLSFTNVAVGKILAVPSIQGETQSNAFVATYTGNSPFDAVSATLNNPDGSTGNAQVLTTLPASVVQVRYSNFQGNPGQVAEMVATLHYQNSNCQFSLPFYVSLNGSGDPQGPGSNSPLAKDPIIQVRTPSSYVNKTAGDPIDLQTGAFISSITDLAIPGRGLDFVWKRNHFGNIIFPTRFELGTSWFNEYLQRLLPNGNDIDYLSGEARVDTFTSTPTGFDSPTHHHLKLTHDVGTDTYTLRGDGNMVMLFHGFTHPTSPGRLKSISDRFGNTMTFAYTVIKGEASLSLITDTMGREIQFSHDSDGRIEEVTDFSDDYGANGRKVTYTYYTPGSPGGTLGQLETAQIPEVSGTSTGNNFDTLGGNRITTTYTYTSGQPNERLRHNIASITDARGNTFLVNTLAATQNENDFLFNRVVTQQFGDPGQDFQFHYEAINETVGTETAVLAIVVNDRKGHVAEHRLNAKGNPVSLKEFTGAANPNQPTTLTTNRPVNKLRPTDPDFYESRMTFDSRGKLLNVIKPRGNQIQMAYDNTAGDEHGQDNLTTLNRTVGTVGTVGGPDTTLPTLITYSDNVFRLPKTSTDPRGFVTNYFYDFDEEPDNVDYNGDSVITPVAQAKGELFRIKRPDITLGASGTPTPQNIVERFEYNPFSQLTQYTDPEGNINTYEYYPENDPDGDGQNLIPGANTATGGYLKQIVVANGVLNLTTTYAYDDVGNMTTMTDPNGRVWTTEFNAINQVVRTFSPGMDKFVEDGGAVYEEFFEYDAMGNMVTRGIEHENATNPGFANGPGFDEANFFETRYTYDTLDNLITMVQEVGNTIGVYPYDTLTTIYTYDPSDNLVGVTHPNDVDQDTTTYDERDLPFEQSIGAADTQTNPSLTRWSYDLNGNLAVVDQPNKDGFGINQQTFTYDGFDRLHTMFDLGRNTTWTKGYDRADNLTLEKVNGPSDKNQFSTVLLSEVQTFFDELNRPHQTNEKLFRHDTQTGLNNGLLNLATSHLVYDRDSRLIQAINANNRTTTYQYDAADRVKTVIDAAGNKVTYVYDANSNPTQVVSSEVRPDGPSDVFTLDYEYDERNDVRRFKDDLNHLTQLKVDSRGFVVVRTDAEGNQWRSLRDGRGLEYQSDRQITDVDFLTIKSTWDERSRLVLYTDAEDKETSFAYDSHNRLKTRTNADDTIREHFYDVADNLVALLRENGDVIFYDHDGANRLISREYKPDIFPSTPAEIADEFAYNGLDQLVFAGEKDGVGGFKFEESFVYESQGPIVEYSQTQGTFGTKTFTMDYDAMGNLKKQSYPGGRNFDYDLYDELERWTDVTSVSPRIDISQTYRGMNRIHETDFGNTLTRTAGYDAIKRMTTLNHQDNLVQPADVKVGFTVGYDKVDNKINEILHSNQPDTARVFEYNNYYQTTGFATEIDPALVDLMLSDFDSLSSDTQFHEVIDYDKSNNPTLVTRNGVPHNVATNEMNETQGVGRLIANVVHDPLGRMTSYQKDNKQFTLTYNRRDQLTQVTSFELGSPGNVTVVAQYGYYTTGMRAFKKTPSLEENFYGTNMTVCEVYEVEDALESSAPTKEFLHEGLDQPLVIFFDANNDGNKQAFYYHTNPRGDVYALSDKDGNIVERYNYSLFGETVVLSGDNNVSNTPPTPFSGGGFKGLVGDPQHLDENIPLEKSRFGNIYGFGGSYLDFETGFYQMRYRFYFPELKGFITRDPIEDDSLGNLYAFGENNPGTLIDPWGLADREPGNQSSGLWGWAGKLVDNVSEYASDAAQSTKDYVLTNIKKTTGWGPAAIKEFTSTFASEVSKRAVDLTPVGSYEALKENPGIATGTFFIFDVATLGKGSILKQGAKGISKFFSIKKPTLAANVSAKALKEAHAGFIKALEELEDSLGINEFAASQARRLAKEAAKKSDPGLSVRGIRPASGTRIKPEGIPNNWKIKNTRSKGGVEYYNPKNPNESVRVMQGNPKSPYPNSRIPYVRQRDSSGRYLNKNGSRGSNRSSDTHIPLYQFKYKP